MRHVAKLMVYSLALGLTALGCGSETGADSGAADAESKSGDDATTSGEHYVTKEELETLCVSEESLQETLDDGLYVSELALEEYLDENEFSTGPHTVDTTLTEDQVDTMVSNNGYSMGDHTVDTKLTEEQVDEMVENNGYALEANLNTWVDTKGYLTTELDPAFAASPAASITEAGKANWSSAYGWGDHAKAGYLTSETDPDYSASPAASITDANKTNWSAAYGWGDHAKAEYLTAETDPSFAASSAATISIDNTTNWSAAYGWGDHAKADYLTDGTDPAFNASSAASITDTDKSNWSTAHSWGDHAKAGYSTGSAVMPGFVVHAGRASAKGSDSPNLTIPLSFGFTFDSPPYVIATSTVNGIWGAEIPTVHVNGIGTTGANIILYRTIGNFNSPTTYNIDWFAVGPGTN
jgi:hypothetical protein